MDAMHTAVSAFRHNPYLKFSKNMTMAVDRKARRIMDYDELMQKEHPIHKIRLHMACGLEILQRQKNNRWMLDFTMVAMVQPFREEKASAIRLSPWACFQLASLARAAATHRAATSILRSLLELLPELHCCQCFTVLDRESLKLCSKCLSHMPVCMEGECWAQYWTAVHRNECGGCSAYVRNMS